MNENQLNIVLLGATGFVGSAVLRHLTSLPADQIRVHALVRDPTRFAGGVPNNFCRLLRGDVRQTPQELFPNTPHVVIHLASRQIDTDGSGFDDVNVTGTRNLSDRLTESTRGILYGSSSSVYGQGEHLETDESASLDPQTALARSRFRAEEIVLEAARTRGIGAYCLRPRFIFGTGDRHTMPGLIKMVGRGVQPGAGIQRYSILDVDDYARILIELSRHLLSASEPERAALNIGYARSISMNDVVDAICKHRGLARPRIRVPVRRWATRCLRLLPSRNIETLATRLELFGLSHTFRMDRLRHRIGDTIPDRDPLGVIETTCQLS